MSFLLGYCCGVLVTLTYIELIVGCSDQLDAEACGIGWKRYGASCYKIKTARKTWVQAVSDCQSEGASLVKVCNNGELEFIYYAFVRPLDTGSAWIGLSLTNGSFHWLDGSWPRYKNWNWGEPNNYNGDEHCVEIYVKNGKWNDIPCFLYRPFVCEKAPSMLHPTNHMSASLNHMDHALVDSTFEELYVSGVTECFEKCLGRKNCLSFNFEYSGVGTRKCQLNNMTRPWARDKFQIRPGFIYYD